MDRELITRIVKATLNEYDGSIDVAWDDLVDAVIQRLEVEPSTDEPQ